MFIEIDMVHSELHALLKARLLTHAAITRRLHTIGCLHWNTTLTEWLTHFEGLEQFYDYPDEKLPAEQVLDALMQIPALSPLPGQTHPQITDEKLALILTHLDFLNVRVKHPKTNERWNSLKQSLEDFLKDESAPIAYMWEESWPAAEEIAEWLMASSENELHQNS